MSRKRHRAQALPTEADRREAKVGPQASPAIADQREAKAGHRVKSR